LRAGVELAAQRAGAGGGHWRRSQRRRANRTGLMPP
jgi:hypothetical protein